MMPFNCFIIFVGKLLGPVLLLVFRSKIRSFTSSTVVVVIKKVTLRGHFSRSVRLFGFFKKLEKCFLVDETFFW